MRTGRRVTGIIILAVSVIIVLGVGSLFLMQGGVAQRAALAPAGFEGGAGSTGGGYGDVAGGPAYIEATGVAFPSPAATMAAAMPQDAEGIVGGEADKAANAPNSNIAEEPSIQTTGVIPPDQQEHMIIKNGNMTLLVEDADTGVKRVTQIAGDNGGYVLSSQVYYQGEYKAATITIAVTSDRFDQAMERLRQIAIQVLAEDASGQDVTGEYVNLQSRLRNLEATRDRIQSFLDKAATVEEALQINQQLADIEAQIEQVKGRMAYLSGRAAFSTITVNLTVPQPTPTPTFTPSPTPTYTPTATPTAWSPGRALSNATKTQTSVFRGLVDALIWLVVVPGPYLVVLALIVWAVREYQRRNPPPAGPTAPPSTPTTPAP